MVIKYDSEFTTYSPASLVQDNGSSLNIQLQNLKTDTLDLSEEALSASRNRQNIPTKGYIDNVIEKALSNIKNGENIAENRRILNIFSNILGENPISKELNAYI